MVLHSLQEGHCIDYADPDVHRSVSFINNGNHLLLIIIQLLGCEEENV